MMDANDIVCEKTRAKFERINDELVRSICNFNDLELTGSISLSVHVAKGQIMKVDITPYYGVKLK